MCGIKKQMHFTRSAVISFYDAGLEVTTTPRLPQPRQL
jgi:hypothetical protein